MEETETSVFQEEVHSIEEIFHKTLIDIKQTMSQKRYRKVLEDIRNKEVMFYMLEDYWKLKVLKIQCMLKIVSRKIENDGGKYKSTEFWVNKINKTLDEWNAQIEENYFDDTDYQHEVFAEISLQHLYNQALISKGEHHIADAAGFLSVGIKLIESMNKYTILVNKKILSLAQSFYIFVSSILISDNDYLTALRYSEKAIQYSLRQLCLLLESDIFTCPEEMKRNDLYILCKVLTNLIFSTFHKGVCEENRGELLTAIQSYAQSRWITENFKEYIKEPELSSFIKGVEKRALRYQNAVNVIRVNFSDVTIKEVALTGKKGHRLMPSDNLNRYNKAKEKIEKLKIPEIDEDENITGKKSEKIKKIMSTLKLTFDLMSTNFKDILHDVKTKKKDGKFEIEKINKGLAEKIQKKLVELRVEKKMEIRKSQSVDFKPKKCPKKKQTALEFNVNMLERDILTSENPYEGKKTRRSFSHVDKEYFGLKTKHSMEDINIISTKTPKETLITKDKKYKEAKEDSYYITPGNIGQTESMKFHRTQSNISTPMRGNSSVTTTCMNSNFKSNTFLSSNRNQVAVKRKEPIDKVEKLAHDKYIFNKDYQRKLRYLDSIASKEITFQKKLLTLKKYEKFEIGHFEKNKVEDEAENFFKKELKSKVGVFIIDESKKKFDNRNNSAKSIKKLKLESNIVMSLDSNRARDLKKLVREIRSEKEEEQMKYVGSENVREELDAKELIARLDDDIDFLSNTEVKLKKELNPLAYQQNRRSKSKSFLFPNKRSSSAFTHSPGRFVRKNSMIMERYSFMNF